MLLKRLELTGFKSFADKTVLDFTEGSTAVVGPNGSGKSNISDAIRWVLGEMSAKQLRGSSMQDVIFAGTEARKALNYTEVSLVLDNSSHIFNTDFDEIVVTRRLFRSGESVYQINKANCRLKDIHELFMDTGLGRDGYSIIGQGNVSQILSTKAEDRRSLFEEAAGVSKYKYRREEAERKLKGVEENLVRIGDITSELESQRVPLKKQSEKAKKYLTYYEEYKGLDVNLSLINIDKNNQNAEKTQADAKNVEEELSALKSEDFGTKEKISALYEKNKAQDEMTAELNNSLIENEKAVTTANNDISIAENNINNNNRMIERFENEIKSITEKIKSRSLETEKLKSDRLEKEKESQIIISELDSAKDGGGEITQKQDELSAEIESLRSESVQKLNEISAKKANIEGIETLRKSFLDRRSALETEIVSFKESVSGTKDSIEKFGEEINAKSEKLKKVKSSVERYRTDIEKYQTETENINARINAKSVEYNSKSSKKKILEGMENDYAGFAKSVKTVLKAEGLKKLAIYGTVSGLIDTDKKYVTAIESTLGGAMQNIVVESEEDAKAAIAYLRRERAGRATFLPITSVKGRELENAREILSYDGVIGIASTLVKYDKKYDGVMKSLLGRVVVVDNIDNAIALMRAFNYKFRSVTLEGDILNAGGSMSGGSVNKQSGFLSRATEIKTLTRELRELSDEIRSLKEKKQRADEDIARVQNQLSSYIPVMREYEDEIMRMELNRQHLEQSLEMGGETEKSYKEELLKIEGSLKDSSEEIAKLLKEVRTLENRAKEIENEVEEKSVKLEEISNIREEHTKELMDKTMMLAALEKDIKFIDSSIENAQNEIAASENDIKRLENDTENIRISIDSLYTTINQKRHECESLNVKSEEIKNNISEAAETKKQISRELEEIQNSNKDLTDRMLNLQQELTRLENRYEKLTQENEDILSRLWDNYELTYSTAQESKTEIEDEKSASQRLKELKSAIKALGSVNVDAIEEYIAVEERFKFLSEQKKDLEKSSDDLSGIISSMEELMEEHFEKQFSEINLSFGEVFRELFGGGNGRLYLSDPDNVLESGIEIEVQLPGKGLQNINLYSGGEKSFIAIALLFAILRVKPAPFCILDEIDAALDDVNVSRFATYLKNYTDQSQFIVITHRRGTMEAANILYGVTMQEKGVSKLLSLRIDDVSDEMVS